MSYAVAAEAAASTRFARTTNEGHAIWRTMFFGPAPSPESSDSVRPDAPNLLEYVGPAAGEVHPPQAFLVEQSPGAVVHPHFHFVDQFQVAVDGGGTIGRHELAPVSAHFASACTGYGPITPGPAGLKYFTLRGSADTTGAQYLPASRAKMKDLPRRNVFFDRAVPSEPAALAARRAFALDVLADEPDGLGAFVLRIPPRTPVNAPDPARGRGVSMIVIAGALDHPSGGRLGRWSCLFHGADEGLPVLTAADTGAEVLVLRYPR
jgi:hypothetical protein